MTSDEAQIRRLVSDWMAATKSGDVDGVLRLMTDDALFLTPGNSPMDKAGFARVAKAQSGSGAPEIDGKSDIKEVQVVGDWAFMWSHVSVRVTPPGNSEVVEREGHTLTIFMKQNGTWLLARDANLLVQKGHGTK